MLCSHHCSYYLGRAHTSTRLSIESNMPTYKLTNFPFRGRAEVARQILHLAGVPFEDVRIPVAEWNGNANRIKTPFGHLPVLEVDGKELPQSFAINRYLAKEFGFAGASPFEAAWVDAIADQFADFYLEIRPILAVYFWDREGDKEKLMKEVAFPARDKFFTILEKIAKDNGINGHFVGSSLTWIDLLIAEQVDVLRNHIPGYLDGFPAVLETVKKIEATPKLKEWIEKRPDTKF